MSRKFEGVISSWRQDGDVIIGICLFHRSRPELQGRTIHTSRILAIYRAGIPTGMVIVQTVNSFYLLVDAVNA